MNDIQPVVTGPIIRCALCGVGSNDQSFGDWHPAQCAAILSAAPAPKPVIFTPTLAVVNAVLADNDATPVTALPAVVAPDTPVAS